MADRRVCVVCLTSIVKNGDKNLVESRGGNSDAFNVKLELKSLPFPIDVDRAKYICKRCLWTLKKRKGAIQKVKSIEGEISKLYVHEIDVKPSICSLRGLTAGNENSCTSSSQPAVSVQSKRDEIQSPAQSPLSTSSTSNALFATTLTISPAPSISGFFMLSPTNIIPSPLMDQRTPHSSTPQLNPCKRPRSSKGDGALYESLLQLKIDKSTQTVKHITNENQTGKCEVTVTVNWPSSERSKQIPEDLHQICKKLIRGRYDNLAAAVWKHDELRKHIIKLFLKELNSECEKICQMKEPSILRKTSKNDMMKFSYNEFEKEMKERIPLFRQVLMTAALGRTKKPEDDLFWQPAVCTAASICLKIRNPCLTALQLLISDIIQHSSFSVRY